VIEKERKDEPRRLAKAVLRARLASVCRTPEMLPNSMKCCINLAQNKKPTGLVCGGGSGKT